MSKDDIQNLDLISDSVNCNRRDVCTKGKNCSGSYQMCVELGMHEEFGGFPMLPYARSDVQSEIADQLARKIDKEIMESYRGLVIKKTNERNSFSMTGTFAMEEETLNKEDLDKLVAMVKDRTPASSAKEAQTMYDLAEAVKQAGLSVEEFAKVAREMVLGTSKKKKKAVKANNKRDLIL